MTTLAAQINGVIATLILISAFGLLVMRRINSLIHVFAWQGAFLALSALIMAYASNRHHLYVSAVLTFAIKVVVLPYIFFTYTKRYNIQKEVEAVVSIPITMIIGIALVIFSYHITSPVREVAAVMTRSTMAVALSTTLIGFLMMITRKKAITQIVGLLAMENGLFFAAVSATYGMPLVVELGIAFDILVVAFVFGIVVLHIRTTFDGIETGKTIEVSELERHKEEGR
jgi:hydrogenase-4 component E